MLPGISTEQLRSRLNRMVADGLLTRQRYREVPPRVDYELTERARDLLPVVGALARWGYRWAWSPPRPGEAIDIGAIFRCAPGLAAPPSAPSGTVELDVTDGAGALTYVLDAGGGHVISRSAPPPRPTPASAAPSAPGSRPSAPTRSRTELEYRGRPRLGREAARRSSPHRGPPGRAVA